VKLVDTVAVPALTAAGEPMVVPSVQSVLPRRKVTDPDGMFVV
jgi:hypothetical protein